MYVCVARPWVSETPAQAVLAEAKGNLGEVYRTTVDLLEESVERVRARGNVM